MPIVSWYAINLIVGIIISAPNNFFYLLEKLFRRPTRRTPQCRTLTESWLISPTLTLLAEDPQRDNSAPTGFPSPSPFELSRCTDRATHFVAIRVTPFIFNIHKPFRYVLNSHPLLKKPRFRLKKTISQDFVLEVTSNHAKLRSLTVSRINLHFMVLGVSPGKLVRLRSPTQNLSSSPCTSLKYAHGYLSNIGNAQLILGIFVSLNLIN